MGNDTSNCLCAASQIRKYDDYYKSRERLGAGTFAIVKKCIRKRDKKEFAVKTIDKRSLTRQELIGLRDEIFILKSISHPNCIKMIDVFDDHRKVKIILPLCSNGDLHDQISLQANHKFNEKNAAIITYKILSALQYLHERNIVHRDIKPSNILFTDENELKLVDFGLAYCEEFLSDKQLREEEEEEKKNEIEYKMNTCCGTPHYVAPEILKGKEYNDKVDLWSLGVVLYYMLSGQLPFQAHNMRQIMRQIMSGDYNLNNNCWNNISNRGKNVVKLLMTVNPKKRITIDKLLKHPWINKHVKNKKKLLKSKIDYDN